MGVTEFGCGADFFGEVDETAAGPLGILFPDVAQNFING